MVVEAQKRGLPASIYRPPLIIGHTETGAYYETNIYCRTLMGLVQLGAVQQTTVPMDVAPIDFVAGALVRLSLRSEALGP